MTCLKEIWGIFLFNKSHIFSLSPEEQIPKWKDWGSIMRPHILWFDESYTQELHQVETVREIMETDIDVLIVIGKAHNWNPKSNILLGTALATSLALKMVKNWLK